MRHRGAGEALESGRRGVDAERHPVGVDLVQDEAVQLVLDLADGGQVPLPVVVEGPVGLGLEVPSVLPDSRGGGGAA